MKKLKGRELPVLAWIPQQDAVFPFHYPIRYYQQPAAASLRILTAQRRFSSLKQAAAATRRERGDCEPCTAPLQHGKGHRLWHPNSTPSSQAAARSLCSECTASLPSSHRAGCWALSTVSSSGTALTAGLPSCQADGCERHQAPGCREFISDSLWNFFTHSDIDHLLPGRSRDPPGHP